MSLSRESVCPVSALGCIANMAFWQPSPGIFLSPGKGWGTCPPTDEAVEGEGGRTGAGRGGQTGLLRSHVSRESHTNLNAQNGFRNLPRLQISSIWSGPVCLRTSSRADLRQLPEGGWGERVPPQIIKIRPLGPAVAGMCICNQLFRCLPCDTERWGLLSGNT